MFLSSNNSNDVRNTNMKLSNFKKINQTVETTKETLTRRNDASNNPKCPLKQKKDLWVSVSHNGQYENTELINYKNLFEKTMKRS